MRPAPAVTHSPCFARPATGGSVCRASTRWSTLASVAICGLGGLASLSWTAAHAAETPPRAVASEIDNEVRRGEGFWKRIAQSEPYPSMGLRGLLEYAHTLARARQHPERMERLLDLACQAQSRDPNSRDFGNTRWYWRDPRVTDANAVDFCLQDASVLWLRHRDWLPAKARDLLREWLGFALEGSLRHRVPVSYTNIALLNAGNLLLLGEILDRPDVTAEGNRRLDAFCLWTWAFGISEYCSPTYYGVDLDAVDFILSHVQQPRARSQAAALQKLFWTDIRLNWFAPAARLAGPHSRSYDYLFGLGELDEQLQRQGWICPALSAATPHAFQATATAGTSAPVPAASSPSMLVRQAWGVYPHQSRTHAIYPDITLGVSAAAYGQHDMPLTVDLPGDRQSPRCYFIADGRDDPYGRKPFATGAAGHKKALHLQPFWAAAQRTSDAVGLVVYRPEDLAGDPALHPRSHLVLRQDASEVWLAGQPLPRPPAMPHLPAAQPVSVNQPLVLRYGTAALGIRLLSATRQDGQPAPVHLVDDANPYGVIRLTVDHAAASPGLAAAALWLRVGSSLADEASFRRWRENFESAVPTAVSSCAGPLRFEVPGTDGPLVVQAQAPFGAGGSVQLLPPPTQAVLEQDGRDIGRPLLESQEPLRSLLSRHNPLQPIQVPAEASVSWEAEGGLILAGFEVGADPAASAGRYVCQPPSPGVNRPVGQAIWSLDVARSGDHYLWARVSATDPQSNSFLVSLAADAGAPPLAWSLRTEPDWHWEPLAAQGTPGPLPLALPAGPCRLLIRMREQGARLDRLLLTPDPHYRPK